MIPVAGSAYTYGYATLGELIAWIIGWDLILEYLFAASTVAVGWSGYVVSFLKDLGIVIPPEYTSAPYVHTTPADAGINVWRLFTEGWSATGAVLNLPAMFIVGLLTVLLIIGISESATFNNAAVIVKVTVVLLFIAFGIGYINADNWTPFVPPAEGPGKYGWDGIVRGAGVIFFAYIGFDAVSTAAQECRNPQKDMPIGILGSLAICTVLYIAVALVLTGIVHYSQLNVPDPIAVGINATGAQLAWLRPIIKIGAIAGLSSVILVMLLGQPRIFYTMSKDGLLPPIFASVHPKFRTPWKSTILVGVFVGTLAGFMPLDALLHMTNIGTLLAFVIVCVAVLIMRKTHPEAERPFRCAADVDVPPVNRIERAAEHADASHGCHRFARTRTGATSRVLAVAPDVIRPFHMASSSSGRPAPVTPEILKKGSLSFFARFSSAVTRLGSSTASILLAATSCGFLSRSAL